MLCNNSHAQLLPPAADSALRQRLSVCRDQIITNAVECAVVRHEPAVQPAPRAGRPQARSGLSRIANRPAAARVQRWLKSCRHEQHDSRFALASEAALSRGRCCAAHTALGWQ